jgi:hypothetical protein
MNKKLVILILFGIFCGIIITIISGLFTYPTGNVLGIIKWGYPFYWLSKVVYPDSTKIINWSNLSMDVLIWSISAILVTNLFEFLIKYINSSKKQKV